MLAFYIKSFFAIVLITFLLTSPFIVSWYFPDSEGGVACNENNAIKAPSFVRTFTKKQCVKDK